MHGLPLSSDSLHHRLLLAVKGFTLALVVVASLFGSPSAVAARTLLPGDTCLTKGSLHTVGTGALECGPKLRWRVVAEGRPCLKVAARTSTLSCINRREGRRWQKPFTYQEQACDPNDPRLSNITLPPEEFLEGRIAAACVALEWLDNANTDIPELDLVAPSQTSATAVQALKESAAWQLQLIWGHRTDYDTKTPTVFLFDSISFLCEDGRKVFQQGYFWLSRPVLGSPGYISAHPNSVYSCLKPESTWGCADTPDIGNGVLPSGWRDHKRAGLIMATCPSGLSGPIEVNPWKFYEGFFGCPITDSIAPALCNNWGTAAMYIFSLYAQELGQAQLDGRSADLNLCRSGSWMGWCPQSTRLFRKSFPSSSWLTMQPEPCWPGSPPFGDDADCSRELAFAYHVKGYVFEWLVAHYGIDTAYGVLFALAPAGSSKKLYLRIMAGYLGMSNDKFFAAIDAYVVARLGDRIR